MSTIGTEPPPLSGKLLRGSAWMVAMRWGMRGLGLISTAILARLLTPADFGLVAMAMAIIALAETLTNFGVEAALLRDKNAGKAQMDTAWTVRQLQLTAVAGLVFLAAPLAAEYYGEARIITALRLVAVGIAIRGLENIGIVNFRRELEFDKDFRFNVLAKFLGIAVTIALAVHFRSYLALVWGMVANNLIGVVLSYLLHPYRPRWSLAVWRELWGFSQWMLVRGLATYIFAKVDVLVLGRMTSASAIGYYSVAGEIAQIPTLEISQPVTRALLPGFAQLVDNPERLRPAFLKSLAAVAIVAFPTSVGMALVAPELVPLLLGHQWLASIPILQIFAVAAMFAAIRTIAANVMTVVGYIRYDAVLAWSGAIALLAGIIPAFEYGDLQGVVYLRLVISAFLALASLYALSRIEVVRMKTAMLAIVRPAIATGIMFSSVFLLGKTSGSTEAMSDDLLMLLGIKIVVGIASYTAALCMLWFWAGRPDGFEAVVIRKVSELVKT